MNSSEDELENQLKRLPELEQAPRPEFVTYLDEKLQKEADALKRRLRLRRVLSRAVTAAAVILGGSWIGVAHWQQQSQSLMYPANADFYSTTLSKPPLAGNKQPPAAADDQRPGVGEPTPSALAQQEAKKSPTADQSGEHSNDGRAGELTAEQQLGEQPEQPLEQSPEQQLGQGTEQPARQLQQDQASNAAAAEFADSVRIAQSYLRNMLGDDSEHYALNMARSKPKEGQVVFNRMIHGIPFYEDCYTVDITDQAVSSFQFTSLTEKQRDIANFPPPVKLVSEQKAAAIIASFIQPVYRSKADGSLALRYELNFPGYLDAVTGVPHSRAGQPLVKTPQSLPAIPVQAEGKKLEAASVEQTAALLRQEFGVRFDGESGTSPSSIVHGDATGFTYTWTGNGSVITANVNKTGRLTAYHVQAAADVPSGQKLTPRQEWQKTAIQHLQRYLAPGVTDVQLMGTIWDEAEVHYQFEIRHDGIPVDHRVYDVALDRTGKLVGFSEESATLTNSSNAISIDAASKEAAMAQCLQQLRLELQYIWPKTKHAGGASESALLVYQLKTK